MPDITLNFQGSAPEYPSLHYTNSQSLHATAVVGTGAGNSASVSITGSSANWVRLAVNTGANPALNGDLCTVTMPVAFQASVCPVACSQSTTTSQDWNKFKFITISTTQWKIVMVGTASQPATYNFAVYIGG